MQIELTPEERDKLLKLLESELAEVRVEKRRTHHAEFHAQLERDARLIDEMLRKLSHPTVSL